jgi:hypothetical protein
MLGLGLVKNTSGRLFIQAMIKFIDSNTLEPQHIFVASNDNSDDVPDPGLLYISWDGGRTYEPAAVSPRSCLDNNPLCPTEGWIVEGLRRAERFLRYVCFA